MFSEFRVEGIKSSNSGGPVRKSQSSSLDFAVPDGHIPFLRHMTKTDPVSETFRFKKQKTKDVKTNCHVWRYVGAALTEMPRSGRICLACFQNTN
jgi:hypothetical protein